MSPPRLPLIQVARDGKVIGEYSLANLGQALRQKSVLLTDHYWREGKRDWERVRYIADEAEREVAKLEPPKIPPPPLPGSTINPTYAVISGLVLMFLGCIFFSLAQYKSKLDVVEIGLTHPQLHLVNRGPLAALSGIAAWTWIGGIVLLVVAFLNRKR